ncbi:MAG: septal ring lytic transglycosylase RlpA family protein [Rhodocyclales bacterium]|nr:septal ring lytic transglycosylase RlpA family protein [Rhodocyclales bacterium]
MNRPFLIFLLLPPLLLAACGSQPPQPVTERGAASGAVSPAPTFRTPGVKPPAVITKRGGGFYKDDGPGENAPADIDAIPDAVPKAEPLHRFANNPYSVLGQDYVPLRELRPYKARGIASWYGRRFHGQKTSSGEPYDMYGMTAAHPTLPIPSYVRVTNPANGKSVVLRVNDRGPFHADRLIDLSWTAAAKLGYLGTGSTQVEVESILPGQKIPAALPEPAAQKTQTAADEPVTSPAAAPARPLPEVARAGGHYIQLGAFGNRDNAEAFQAHIARELDWLSDHLHIEAGDKVHRVHAGPWRDRAEAEQMAEKVRLDLGVKPTIVRR